MFRLSPRKWILRTWLKCVQFQLFEKNNIVVIYLYINKTKKWRLIFITVLFISIQVFIYFKIYYTTQNNFYNITAH